jgi:hypothetical protein
VNRRSYNQSHSDYVARVRAANPQLAALWGEQDDDEAAAYAAEQQAPDEDEDATDLG